MILYIFDNTVIPHLSVVKERLLRAARLGAILLLCNLAAQAVQDVRKVAHGRQSCVGPPGNSPIAGRPGHQVCQDVVHNPVGFDSRV